MLNINMDDREIKMKKMITAGLIVAGSILGAQSAMAGSQTVSLGYAHGKMDDVSKMNGINLQYRYELDDSWGLMGSFTWMKGNDSLTTMAEQDRIEGNYDAKILLSAGRPNLAYE